ncbi:hypothetical protein Tco_0233235 [Tanacetum coccineum]
MYETNGKSGKRGALDGTCSMKSIGKGCALGLCQWSEITMRKRKNLLSKYKSLNKSSPHKVIGKWTSSRVTLDQLLSEHVPGNIVMALGGTGKRKEKGSSKEIVFTKSDVSNK